VPGAIDSATTPAASADTSSLFIRLTLLLPAGSDSRKYTVSTTDASPLLRGVITRAHDIFRPKPARSEGRRGGGPPGRRCGRQCPGDVDARVQIAMLVLADVEYAVVHAERDPMDRRGRDEKGRDNRPRGRPEPRRDCRDAVHREHEHDRQRRQQEAQVPPLA